MKSSSALLSRMTGSHPKPRSKENNWVYFSKKLSLNSNNPVKKTESKGFINSIQVLPFDHYSWTIDFVRFAEFIEFTQCYRAAMKLGQGYVFTGVCDSVHREGTAPLHARIYRHHQPPPWDQRQAPPPTRYQPPTRTRHPPKPGTTPAGADTPFQTRHALQTRTPSSAVHAGRYGQQTGSTHPTGMQSCYCIYCLVLF